MFQDEIGRITELIPGECEQEKFRKFLKNHVIDRCLSVKFGDSESLEIVFDSTDDFKLWSNGIDKLRLNTGMIIQPREFMSVLAMQCRQIR